jgi:hypothetical protein
MVRRTRTSQDLHEDAQPPADVPVVEEPHRLDEPRTARSVPASPSTVGPHDLVPLEEYQPTPPDRPIVERWTSPEGRLHALGRAWLLGSVIAAWFLTHGGLFWFLATQQPAEVVGAWTTVCVLTNAAMVRCGKLYMKNGNGKKKKK